MLVYSKKVHSHKKQTTIGWQWVRMLCCWLAQIDWFQQFSARSPFTAIILEPFWRVCELYCASMNHAVPPFKDYERHVAESIPSIPHSTCFFLHGCINRDTIVFNPRSMCSVGRGRQNWKDGTWNGAHLSKMKVSLLGLWSWQDIDSSLTKPWGSNTCLTTLLCTPYCWLCTALRVNQKTIVCINDAAYLSSSFGFFQSLPHRTIFSSIGHDHATAVPPYLSVQINHFTTSFPPWILCWWPCFSSQSLSTVTAVLP